MSTYGKFFFHPLPGEQVTTELRPQEENRAAIVGRVLDGAGAPVEGAVALLFQPEQEDALTLISRFVTDEDGHFIFGPLKGGALYLIKVFCNDLPLRELEIRTES